MDKKVKRKLKKIFNLYNLAIVVCVIIIVISMIIVFKPDFKSIFPEKVQNNENAKIVESQKSGDQLSEKEARKMAEKQFKELGEKKLNKDEFEVVKIEREGEEYYYVSSPENTLEIKITTGEITRINSVKVEK